MSNLPSPSDGDPTDQQSPASVPSKPKRAVAKLRCGSDAAETKVDQALELLKAIGFPLKLKSDKMQRRLARILLAVCDLKPATPWGEAKVYTGDGSWSLRSRDVLRYINQHYGESLSDGSYDDIRRENLQFLVEAGLVLASAEDPDADTNDGTRGYGANPAAADVLRTVGQDDWADHVKKFVEQFGKLGDILERKRTRKTIPVKLPSGVQIELLAGPHNELQRAIVEVFLPQFAAAAQVLYIGDAAHKALYKDEKKLTELKFFEVEHDRLPDVIAYLEEKNWLFLIEAVHSSNPVSHLRHLILERAAENCTAEIVYVSVFKDRASFAEWVKDISWDTEVWLSESPDHMIHFNGDKFLGPHKARTTSKPPDASA